MEPDYAARMLKRVLELQANGATWSQVAAALKIGWPGAESGCPCGTSYCEGCRLGRWIHDHPDQLGKIAKRRAREAAKVSQRVLLEQNLTLS